MAWLMKCAWSQWDWRCCTADGPTQYLYTSDGRYEASWFYDTQRSDRRSETVVRAHTIMEDRTVIFSMSGEDEQKCEQQAELTIPCIHWVSPP